MSPNIASLLQELHPKALWDVFLVAVGPCGCSEGDLYSCRPSLSLVTLYCLGFFVWSAVCWAVTWKDNYCCLSIRIRCLQSCWLGLCHRASSLLFILHLYFPFPLSPPSLRTIPKAPAWAFFVLLSLCKLLW